MTVPSTRIVRCIAQTSGGERCRRTPAPVVRNEDVKFGRLCAQHRAAAKAAAEGNGPEVQLVPPGPGRL